MKRFSIRLVTFIFLSIGIFVLFLLLWPLMGSAYGAAFREAGNILTGGGPNQDVWFTSLDAPSESHDIRLRLINRAARLQQSIELSSRRHAFLPTAFLLAFTLASPLSWRTRRRVLAWTLLWLHFYIILKLMLLPLAYVPHAVGASPGNLQVVLRRSFEVFSATSAGWMIPPLIIWFLVAWRFGLSTTLLDPPLKLKPL